MSDGSIIIDTKINSKGMDAGVKGIQKNMNSLAKSVTRIGKLIGTALAAGGVIKFAKECMNLASQQEQAEAKLETVMRQRMNATDQSIKSVKELAKQQQELGIIGDELQLAGAQQLATFLDTSTALEELIPAMNNLAAQQKGVNASQGDMVNIGNLMGKVMQGQTSALTRVGITFSEAEEKILKYGNEQERAAMLAKVITNNVGNMNAALAQTPDGQIKQLKNNLGDIMETLGTGIKNFITPFLSVLNKLLAKLATVANAFKALSELITGKKSKSTVSDGLSGMATTGADASQALSDVSDSTDDAAKSAKEAAKQTKKYLSGLDEIRTYTEDVADSGYDPSKIVDSAPTGAAADIVDFGAVADTSETVFDKMAQNIKAELETLWEPIKRSWDTYGKGVIDSAKFAFGEIWGLMGDIAKTFKTVWTNGNGEQVLGALWQYLTNIFNLIGTIGSAFREVWNNGTGEKILTNIFQIMKNIWTFLGNIVGAIDNALKESGLVQVVTQGILNIYNAIFTNVKNIWGALASWAAGLNLTPLFTSLANLASVVLPTIEKVIGDIGRVAQAILENVILPVLSWLIETALPFIVDLITTIFTFISENIAVVEAIGAALITAFGAIKLITGLQKIVSLLSLLFTPQGLIVAGVALAVAAGVALYKNWDKIKDTAKRLYENVKTAWEDMWTKVDEMCEKIKTLASDAWDSIKKTASEKWGNIKTTLSGLWGGFKELASTKFGEVKGAIDAVWGDIKTAVSNAWEKASGIGQTLTSAWDGIKDSAGEVWGGILDAISSRVQGFHDAIGGIKDAIVGLGSSFTDLPNVVKSPINSLIGLINGMVGGVTNGINGLFKMLNSIHISIPSWVPRIGGRSLGFNLQQLTAPQIPYLAKGAVIPPNAPFTAVLGDQKNGNNIETPERLLRQIMREELNGGGGGSYQFTAQINRRTLFDEIIDEAKLRQRQTGFNPLTSF